MQILASRIREILGTLLFIRQRSSPSGTSWFALLAMGCHSPRTRNPPPGSLGTKGAASGPGISAEEPYGLVSRPVGVDRCGLRARVAGEPEGAGASVGSKFQRIARAAAKEMPASGAPRSGGEESGGEDIDQPFVRLADVLDTDREGSGDRVQACGLGEDEAGGV